MMNPVRTYVIAALIVALFAGPAIAAETAQKGTLEQYFQKARQDYLQKDMKAAADEVRKASAWVKSEAAQARGKGMLEWSG